MGSTAQPGMRRRRIFAAAGAGLLGGGLMALASCSSENANGKTSPAGPPGVPVTVAAAAQRAVPVQVRAVGNVQAYTTVTIKSQVDGQVLRVHFTEGQDVRRGDLLFTLDQRPFEADLQRAEGTLARDQAQLKQAEANLAKDLAQHRNAEVQARRYKELISEGAIAAELYDQVRTTAETFEASVQADRAAVENARAAIRTDEAMVENARIQLGYTVIRAPMEGRTGNLLVHPGSTVKARDDASSMVVINQVHPIYAAFAVPEQYLADIRRYRTAGTLKVEGVIPGQEKEPARGELTFVNNTVDPATGTIQLKATFANADNRLWPGQFLGVVLALTTEPNAVVVPSQAIQAGQQGTFVFVVKPDLTVEARPVVPGIPVDNEIVVQKGLAAGERVVTEGQIRLIPGAKVDVKTSGPTAVPGAQAR